MTRFYLMRHGDKEKTMGDPPLTEKGRGQAQRTAKYLKQFPITHVLASPTLRTQQTAQPIASALHLPIIIEPKLTERMNWGDDPSQTFEEFIHIWQKSTLDPEWNPPIGISAKQSGSNMDMVLRKHAKEPAQIAVIAHGGIIADFLLNIFPANVLDAVYPNFSKIKEDIMLTCSITVVDFDEKHKTFTLQKIAGVEHLV